MFYSSISRTTQHINICKHLVWFPDPSIDGFHNIFHHRNWRAKKLSTSCNQQAAWWWMPSSCHSAKMLWNPSTHEEGLGKWPTLRHRWWEENRTPKLDRWIVFYVRALTYLLNKIFRGSNYFRKISSPGERILAGSKLNMTAPFSAAAQRDRIIHVNFALLAWNSASIQQPRNS